MLGGVQTPTLKSLNLSSLVAATGLIGGLIGAPLANSQTFLGTSIPSYGDPVPGARDAGQPEHPVGAARHRDRQREGRVLRRQQHPLQGRPVVRRLRPADAGRRHESAGSIGQNIQREKLNLTLNVTPHISSNDAVRLEIEQETKDIGGTDPELGPTWTERKLKTQVVVHDQQSVVIGGLIQERDIYNVTKVPLLGDIPILGYLFKYSTKTKKKTNLLILLTPYIIKDQLDLAGDPRAQGPRARRVRALVRARSTR